MSVPESSRQLDDLAVPALPDDVAAAVAALRRTARIPGLSLAVVDRDGLRFAGGAGFRNLGTKAPATARTAYLWFSMSKIATATAALRLSDEGILDLDAPIDAYLDYMRRRGPRQPTVRELLCHTAGLINPLPLRWVHPVGGFAPDPEVLLRRLADRRKPYRHPVEGRARYSNVGYLAAGQVIAAAAGMPFEAYVHQAVLEPTGMRRTGYRYGAHAERATGYVRAPRAAHPALRRLLPAGIVGTRQGPFLELNPFYVDGPAFGGLVGDVLDAGRLLRLHLNDGELDGRRVLATDTTRGMRMLASPGRPFDHGIGWFRRPTPRSGDWVEHFGAGAGFWNVLRLYPARGIGIAVMANTTTAYDFEPLFELITGAS